MFLNSYLIDNQYIKYLKNIELLFTTKNLGNHNYQIYVILYTIYIKFDS